MSDDLPPTHEPAGGQQPPQNPYDPPPAPGAWGQPPYAGSPSGAPTADERNWASAAHWGSFVAAFFALAFLAPLVVMLARGPQSPFVRRHAVESLNFQISMLIYGTVGAIAAVLLTLVTFGLALVVMIPAALALAVLWIFLVIQASIRAANGEDYRYPFTLRLVS